MEGWIIKIGYILTVLLFIVSLLLRENPKISNIIMIIGAILFIITTIYKLVIDFKNRNHHLD